MTPSVFSVQLRLYPDNDGQGTIDSEEIISALAHSTAADAISDALCCKVKMQLLSELASDPVIVFVNGGVVQDVVNPTAVDVLVRDYDVDGTEDDDRIQTDENGERHWLSTWPSEIGQQNPGT